MQFSCQFCHEICLVDKTLSIQNCSYCDTTQDVAENEWSKGAILGYRYKVIDKIARGGHGIICLARDIFEEKNRVLKIFVNESFDQENIETIIREAELSKKFVHPNLVQTFGGNIDGDVFYIVQEWVPGIDLYKFSRAYGKLTCDEAAYVILKMCDAMDYLWLNFSILHRDIKPENIMLDTEGNVILTDFGIMSPSYIKEDNDKLHCTPDYVSPEAATSGYQLDIGSDIYSLGATIYKLVS